MSRGESNRAEICNIIVLDFNCSINRAIALKIYHKGIKIGKVRSVLFWGEL